jgi:hypothetical protein
MTGPAPNLSISLPREGQQVSYRTTIEGTSEGVFGTNWKIYVLIKPEEGEYWVQPAVSISPNGRWEVIPYFGTDPAQSRVDVGKGFKISAIATNVTLPEGKWEREFPYNTARVDVNVVRK